jgi:mono/diheme cytochrome c family protein
MIAPGSRETAGKRPVRLGLRMRFFKVVVAVLACLPVLVLAGCGGQSTVDAAPQTVIGPVPKQATTTTAPTKHTGNATAGKAVFASAGCNSCHTLKDAGATGTVGPNLDQVKPPYDKVVSQVTTGGGGMPAFKGTLSAQQIQDVAAYVSSVAGK